MSWDINRLYKDEYSDEWPERAKELEKASREVAEIFVKYNATYRDMEWITSRLPYILKVSI